MPGRIGYSCPVESPASTVEPLLSPEAREQRLVAWLGDVPGVLVAFSGGVDSSYLLAVAVDRLGTSRIRAVMGVSASVPEVQRAQARAVADQLGVRIEIAETAETENPDYIANRGDRCFHCKDTLYAVLAGMGVPTGWVIVDGTNRDDVDGHRPGHAAAQKAGVRSPLLEVGLRKDDIRTLSRRRGLPTADLPSSPCLASRFPAGVPVTVFGLGRVERAEAVLRDLGFVDFRVRDHGDIARLELGAADIARAAAPDVRARIADALRALGYRWVALDLDGYRQGSGSLPSALDV